MCGRITATFEFSDIRVRWNLDRDLASYTPRFNIAPENPTIPVIVRQENSNECRSMRWGLVPHWAKDPKIGYRTINARAETVDKAPSFRLAFAKRRCLIPADGFYEWRKTVKPKLPFAIAMKDGRSFTFAGLWENWQDPESPASLMSSSRRSIPVCR